MFLKKLYNDFIASPRSIKIAFPVMLLIGVFLTQACVSIGPSPAFVGKQKENAEMVFPIMEKLIDDADKSSIFKILNVESASDKAVADYKESLKLKLKSWKYLIDKENAIAGGYKNE